MGYICHQNLHWHWRIISSCKTGFPIIDTQCLWTTESIMVCNDCFVTATNSAVVTAIFICVVVQEDEIFFACYHQHLPYKNNKYLSSPSQSSSLFFFQFLNTHLFLQWCPSAWCWRITCIAMLKTKCWLKSDTSYPSKLYFFSFLVHFFSVKPSICHPSGPPQFRKHNLKSQKSGSSASVIFFSSAVSVSHAHWPTF